MINTYSTNKDEEGNIIPERTVLFIRDFDEEGNIQTFQSGNFFTPDTAGVLFIVDNYVINQIDKLLFKDGILSVKENEKILKPIMTPEEKRIVELEKEMAKLKRNLSDPIGPTGPTF